MVEARLHFRSSGKLTLTDGFDECSRPLKHLGGIHSGCALSGLGWLTLKVVETFRQHDVQHDSVLIAGVFTNLAVAISALSAFPWVRNTHHK